eukprot:814801-Amorphochlora_amoeboformis.AAC.1
MTSRYVTLRNFREESVVTKMTLTWLWNTNVLIYIAALGDNQHGMKDLCPRTKSNLRKHDNEDYFLREKNVFRVPQAFEVVVARDKLRDRDKFQDRDPSRRIARRKKCCISPSLRD